MRKVRNMSKISLLIIILVLCSISAIAEPQYYFKVYNSKTNIKIPCLNNNTYCSNATNCNITIIDSNNNDVVLNNAMTNNIAYHNYTLTNISVLGDYQATMICNDSNRYGYSLFSFQVNNVGKKIENVLPYTLVLVVLFIISLVGIFIFLSVKNPLAYPLMISSALLNVGIFFYLYMNTMALSNVFYMGYMVSLFILSGICLLCFWELVIFIIEIMTKKKKKEKDFNDRF